MESVQSRQPGCGYSPGWALSTLNRWTLPDGALCVAAACYPGCPQGRTVGAMGAIGPSPPIPVPPPDAQMPLDAPPKAHAS
jgi:hypothetical protein